MAGTVYLKINGSVVKLEGITFKTKEFEYLCKMDFLFPGGRVWHRQPIVGVDVIRHPRDPTTLLVLLCFGAGCVILRFAAGEPLPAAIQRFLSDKRIQFVGFGIPEKKILFPFEELGLTKEKVDIGYLAAKVLKEPKCKKWELADLAHKVLGIKRMEGLTDASSFERHERIKCAICQLFVTSIIAMQLLRGNDKKKDGSHKKRFLRKLNSLQILTEGLFKSKKKNNEMIEVDDEEGSVHVHIGEMDDLLLDDDFLNTDDDYTSGVKVADHPSFKYLLHVDGKGGDPDNDDQAKDVSCTTKTPLKGILKCPSTGLQSCRLSQTESMPAKIPRGTALKRANSKGFNVRFKSDNFVCN